MFSTLSPGIEYNLWDLKLNISCFQWFVAFKCIYKNKEGTKKMERKKKKKKKKTKKKKKKKKKKNNTNKKQQKAKKDAINTW